MRLPNGMIPRNLRPVSDLLFSFGIERFDRAAKLGEVGADAGVGVDRLDRPVEEAVRGAGGFGDFLAAHRGQLIDLLAEFGAVRVERGKFVDELGDAIVELAGLVALQRHQPGGFGGDDRLERLGRVELQLGRGCGVGRGFTCHGLSRSLSLLRAGGGWTDRRPPRKSTSTVLYI